MTVKIEKSFDNDKNTLEIIDCTENIENIQKSNVTIVNIKNKDELLHLASAYGDIKLMSYAIALDADTNLIIDRQNLYIDDNITCKINKTLNGYSPLIKAIHSVSIYFF